MEEGFLLLDAIPEPLLITESDGGIRWANRRATALIGEEKLTGNLVQLFPPEEQTKLIQTLQAVGEQKEASCWGVKLLNRQGKEIAIELKLTAYKEWLIVLLRDVTADKIELEQLKIYARELSELYRESRERALRLEELDKLRNQFLWAIAHELKTPFTSLKAAWELYLEAGGGFKQLEQNISCSLARLGKLIDELLEIPSLKKSLPPLQKETCDIVREIRLAVISTQYQAKGKALKVKLALPPSLKARVDRYRFQQILTNLLLNAIKFTPVEGKVEIRLKKDKGRFLCQISDTGPGIEAKHLPYIWEPFYTGNGLSQGLGLGLFIVKRLVEAHGGQVSVDSSPGKGCSFSLSFPLK